MQYFPLALNLEGRRCVVVGGGAVAARRAEALLEAGGVVNVVAPEVCAAIRALAEEGRLVIHKMRYRASHLDGASLVIAATDQPAVNAAVTEDARARNILCNDAEMPERSDFIVPSSVRRGSLLLAVTTSGSSPSLAARIREELAAAYGPEYAAYTAILGECRALALQTISDVKRRRAALNALAEDERTLALIREGRVEEARTRALSCISSLSD